MPSSTAVDLWTVFTRSQTSISVYRAGSRTIYLGSCCSPRRVSDWCCCISSAFDPVYFLERQFPPLRTLSGRAVHCIVICLTQSRVHVQRRVFPVTCPRPTITRHDLVYNNRTLIGEQKSLLHVPVFIRLVFLFSNQFRRVQPDTPPSAVSVNMYNYRRPRNVFSANATAVRVH